ncbi:ATP-binding cassette domain-containing protein [Tamlana haliotis]|uniref:ATP-binding cassette domain-containing protein n=1 Tax=Pseudotamlana haliotis TaxID=2614804 RepID=A0A6N6ML04_9FLAO|nr:ATP-binding cassette domain-containing protein [Tamlana haliotis]KAB1071915.1 ATP-binding cassette domain-containing protein [Tamlana haliotis]
MEHSAFYISNKEDKQSLLKNIVSGKIIQGLEHEKGEVFSEITLNKFIQEEQRHDKYLLTTPANNSVLHASGGERKQALLFYILTKTPYYIILDNVLDSLDVSAQDEIIKTLSNLSREVVLIQLFSRQKELLPFITNLFYIKNGKCLPIKNLDVLELNLQSFFKRPLPEPEKIERKTFKTLVSFNGVSISYGEKPVVKNITWEIKQGEFWKLVGANGSGKSTLISLITGENPKAYNQDIALFDMQKGTGESVWDIRNNIGYYAAERLRGFKRLDSVENMLLSGFYDSIGLYKYPTERQKMIAYDWLKLLGLFSVKNKDFLSLSVGQQRLVLIARAMVKHPPLLILDEPTNSLDDADARIFSELVNKIASESETAIIYVSHRDESSLITPDFIFKLTPNDLGSTGQVL